MAQLVFSKQIQVKGSDRIHVNVDLADKPFAQLWTFKDTKQSKYGWHASITGTDHYELFEYINKDQALLGAKAWVQDFANWKEK